jgi:glycine/D-amino acid oxidase-like deaminating enzyme
MEPRLPVPLANLSLWQRTVAAHPLLNARAETPLPPDADIVVIGGGLCGAVLSHALLYPDEHGQSGDVGRVVLLEARSLASGASGRNAGHCRPDAGRGFPMYERLHGPAEAVRILESEAEVLKR